MIKLLVTTRDGMTLGTATIEIGGGDIIVRTQLYHGHTTQPVVVHQVNADRAIRLAFDVFKERATNPRYQVYD